MSYDDDSETALVRVKLKGCDSETLFEMEMDAADFEVVKSIVEKANAAASGCGPTMELHFRVAPGELDDDDAFQEAWE